MKTNALGKYRPYLHFAPQKNWMNDPNGLIFFDGEYHLFYQYHPDSTVWGPMHWGHAVSKDLIDWEELDIALYPDEHGMIFSGSAVVDWENTTGFFPNGPGLVAVFTYHLDGEAGAEPTQTQGIAYSYDRGRTWVKYEGNSVLTSDSKVDFRDPKVFWNDKEKNWMMVLATGQTISFYSSPNLINWNFESEFGEGIGLHTGVWECPDLFQLQVPETDEIKWVLLVSVGDNPEFETGSQTQYFVGEFDGRTFKPDHDSIHLLDFGKDNYAGVSFSDIPQIDGRRIYLGWMSNWRYANEVPTNGWRSQMTLPRELSLQKVGEEYNVNQLPVKEIESYFSIDSVIDGEVSHENGTKKYPVGSPFVDCSINIERENSQQFGITVNHSKEQTTNIEIDYNMNAIRVVRKDSGEIDFSSNFIDDQIVKVENINELNLRMIIDSSSIELFINEGQYALTSLVYPDHACESISFSSIKGSVILRDGYIAKPAQ
ncbi:glycoside hydrolase family 32 protein [Pseudalkalibacillus hwajinpoensis]|uniref:Glycoside hydrolase family 32 protein n=1 Tax=Guptibacillus hwajinpoensis TaxID=208199 RepID=A0A4U1MJX3_9BACL|nr:glycoside hydrolase family 32 protein [Pseudalkalibacillus hwajinpoensis]TKD70782.1 glycoside hydrolase family 32 protein [Pseudalkalibacillus hwajinpoensis]